VTVEQIFKVHTRKQLVPNVSDLAIGEIRNTLHFVSYRLFAAIQDLLNIEVGHIEPAHLFFDVNHVLTSCFTANGKL
jgi:hypothetical protein